MWDEKNLRTGMTWLKPMSAIGKFGRPSALKFLGLRHELTMCFSSAPFSAWSWMDCFYTGQSPDVKFLTHVLAVIPTCILTSDFAHIFQLILSENYFSRRTPTHTHTHTCFLFLRATWLHILVCHGKIRTVSILRVRKFNVMFHMTDMYDCMR